MRLFFHKLTHWEYWPFAPVYFPVIFLWAYYSLRARSIFFFNACNPTIRNGGFLAESKKEIYDLIPSQYYPKTILLNQYSTLHVVLTTLKNSGISYPLIAKPDIGLRGSAVKKIQTEDELLEYAGKANFDYLLQDMIPFPNEFGIFYVRFPHQKVGKITGIVGKEFLIVTGDGISTIEKLIKKNRRHELQLKALRKEYGKQLLEILPKDEKRNLVPYGNHARGAKFIDATHLVTPKLTETIDDICSTIPGFYFGRIDIMYSTFEELEIGENFSIVEVNGAGSEPTHIYDPKHSIFFAWKELMRHVSFMYKISVANHKNGAPYLSHKAGMKEYRKHQEQVNRIIHF